VLPLRHFEYSIRMEKWVTINSGRYSSILIEVSSSFYLFSSVGSYDRG